MPKYTPAEFARLIGKNNATVSMAVKRQHLLKKDGKIDTEEPQNRAWLEDFVTKNNMEWGPGMTLVSKGQTPPAAAPSKPAPKKQTRKAAPAGDDDTDEEDLVNSVNPELMNASEEELKLLGINELRELDLVWSILKRREDTALARIKKEKQEGLLLPTEAVKFLFIRDVKERTTAYENGLNKMLNDMQQRYKISDEDAARYKEMVIEAINIGNREAAEATKREIDNIITDLQEVRGRGEKK